MSGDMSRRLFCALRGVHDDKGVEETSVTLPNGQKVYYEYKCQQCGRIREYER